LQVYRISIFLAAASKMGNFSTFQISKSN